MSKLERIGDFVRYQQERNEPLKKDQVRELQALGELPDSEIDFSDMPEWTSDMALRAKQGALYRPLKEAVSVRVDADVLAWLKKDGPGYQTRINAMLRERMLADLGARK